MLSSGLSVWIGLAILHTAPGGSVDFQGIFYGTRCLMEQHDPYKLSDLRATYMEAARELPPGGIYRTEDVLGFVYQPTVFPLIAPLVWLGWGVAYRVWTLLLIVAGGRPRSSASHVGACVPCAGQLRGVHR